MKLVEEGSEREAELLEEYSHKGLQLQAHVEFERQRIDREKGLIMKGIYRDIKEAVKKVASDGNRYDIVMLNDSVKEITASGEGQVLQAISQRRMLYTNPMLDITDEVMSFMNNEFNAGG